MDSNDRNAGVNEQEESFQWKIPTTRTRQPLLDWTKIRALSEWFRQAMADFLVWLKPQRKCPYCLALVRNIAQRQVGKAVIPKCANCGHDLPADFFATNGKVIALVGGPETTKSTYITVLVDQLLSNRSLLKTLGIQAGIIDREGKKIYNRQREKLIVQHEALDGNDPNYDNRPIVLRLRQSHSNQKGSMFLTLFDTPGEEFNDPDKLVSKHPHIANADAIIFMIDPLNIEAVYEEVMDNASEEEAEHLEGKYHQDYDIINNLVEVFGREKKINPLGKVSAPAAFCVSKVDLLDKIMSIYIPEDIDHELLSSEEIFEEIEFCSRDLHEFLAEKDNRLVNNIQDNFSRFQFFPVAPIGKLPQGQYIVRGIDPKGVLHPLMWILHQINFV